MSLSTNHPQEVLNNTTAYIYRYGNLLVWILGNIGNLLSAIIFLRKSWRNNVCVFYFKICFLLSLIYLNSTILGFTLFIGFDIHAKNSSVLLCKLFYYMSSFISTLLPTVLILASIDRFLLSSENANTRSYHSKWLAYLSVGVSTIFWFVFNFHMLVKVNLQQISPSVVFCSYDPTEFYYDFVYHCLTIIDVLFCFIILILCIVSFKSIRRMRSCPRQRRIRIQSRTKKDFQLLRCLYVHNVIYIMSSIFSAVYSVYAVITKDQIRSPLKLAVCDFLSDLFTFLSFIFYCLSFFIFLAISQAFRYELKQLVYKLLGKSVTPMPRRSSNQRDSMQINVELNVIVDRTHVSSI